VITEADLPAAVTVSSDGAAHDGHGVPVEERTRLLHALERSRWNQSRAAEELGISRTTLWRKLREHRIAT
jgi:transcriptional regulator of acetoin/glycerol metabolism